jgi:hypothetical protein
MDKKSGSSSSSGAGISFAGALAIAFVVLKLTGHIGWSWLWVTSPLWGGLALMVVILLAIVAVALIAKGR